MSVQSETSRVQYVGNGSTATPYPVPFPFFAASDIHVVVTDAAGTEYPLAATSGFTATGAGSPNGGNVTTVSAYDSTHTITIYREIDATQPTSFEENDAFPAKTTEKALDRLTMLCQQVKRSLARCFQVSEASPFPAPLQINAQSPVNSVFVSGDDGRLHLWPLAKVAQMLSAEAAVPKMLNAMELLYPVGQLYLTIRSENPRDILGFGTWQRYGAGRMLASKDANNPAFAVAGQTGGEEKHALTAAENGQHSHAVFSQTLNSASAGNHSHTVAPKTINATTNTEPAHVHSIGPSGISFLTNPSSTGAGNLGNTEQEQEGGPDTYSTRYPATNSSGAHSHTVQISIDGFNTSTAGAHVHSVTIPEQNTANSGSGTPHNNLPPYIVVNVWVRVSDDQPEEIDNTTPFPDDPALVTDGITGAEYRIVVNNGVIGIEPV